MANEAAKTAEPSGGMTANQLLFGFSGRVARLQVWLVLIAAGAIFTLFWAMVNIKAPADPTAPPPPRPPGTAVLEAMPWIIGLALIWPLVAIGVKRCHDRGRSGWWMLLALVPVAGWAWLVWDLGIARGQPAANPYGPPATAQGEGTRDIRSVSSMFFLGFAAGLPALLIFDTLTLWLRDADIKLTVIGFFSLATLFTALKFLWAPVIDRTSLPLLTRWLGHRRSWMLVAQAVIILGLWLIAGQNPKSSLVTMAALAVMVGFFSATQDIVIDAWRIEVVGVEKQGAMAAAYQWGYRVAMIVAGVLPLILAEAFDWHISYAVMAGVMGLGIAATLAAPRETEHRVRPSRWRGSPPARPSRGLNMSSGAFCCWPGPCSWAWASRATPACRPICWAARTAAARRCWRPSRATGRRSGNWAASSPALPSSPLRPGPCPVSRPGRESISPRPWASPWSSSSAATASWPALSWP
jgi:uncharacterized membrane protein YhaH (DUF805 family)